jgi:DedD protein
MDQGLKERLVGAAVLVAIGVWLIPWVLDGPENPVETSPASLQLPAAQEPVAMRTQTLKLGEPPPAAQPEAAVAPPPPAETVDAPAETVIAARAPEPAEPPPPSASVGAPTAAAPPPTLQITKPPVAESQRKAAAPATAPAPAAAAGKGSWTVQLGVFGDEGNARRLADRASTFGYKASVGSYKANGKTMYRVRLGSYPSKQQAEAASSALGAHGVTARVVAAD